MSKMLQVRDVPDSLHRALVRRAKARGLSLTDYVQGILEREVMRPPAQEVFERVRTRQSVRLERPAADLIRSERGEGRAR